MKKISVAFSALMLFALLSVPDPALSHMGEKHGGEMTHHQEHACPHCQAGMEVLHESMRKLNSLGEEIYNSIISGQYGFLAKPAGEIVTISEKLKATKPHIRLSRIGEYRENALLLKEKGENLLNFLESKDFPEIGKAYGDLLAVCVRCHSLFRDFRGKAAGNTRHYEESSFSISDEGHFSVEALIPAEDLRQEKGYVDFVIHDENDEDLTGGIVRAYLWKVHEGEKGEECAVRELGGGRYRVELNRLPATHVGIFLTIRKPAEIRAEDVVDTVVVDVGAVTPSSEK
ncbi:MAG: hypothetical protein D6713_08100 [Deltaproteobacteria bacterium]|nr:MAG: hypothetical protein D6713_08100 [Deltaproteobacteria bacterium]